MNTSKRKADDSLNGSMTEKPATKKAHTNESVDDHSKSVFGAVCPGYEAQATLSLTTTIESLETKQFGEKVLVGNHLKWYMFAKRLLKDDSFSVWVRSDDQYKYPLTFDVEYTLEAVDKKDRITKTWTRVYDNSTFFFGVFVLEWEKLLNDRDKFETDGKITMTAEINVRISNFYFNFYSARLSTDVVIGIDWERFPVNKTFLAAHSDYFKTLFFGPFEEAKQEVVFLKDVDSAAFVNLINFLFVPAFKLKMSSVASVLELADRFGMLVVISHCEELLLNCDPLVTSLADKLVLAAKYSLDKLEKRCLELCDSAKIIRDVRKSKFYEPLPDALKAKLFEQVIDAVPQF